MLVRLPAPLDRRHSPGRAQRRGLSRREALKLGLGALAKHHSAFKRIAVVSDKSWVAHALHAFAWMMPGELAVFGLDELDRAKQWAAG